MSETPSKLRQPRKLSAKVDLEALNDGRFDPMMIENLKIKMYVRNVVRISITLTLTK